MNVKQCQDQCPGIFVDLHGNLVYAGKRMQHIHIILGPAHEFLIQNIEILQPDIIFLVEEALSLYACHIEKIKFGDDVLKLDALLIGVTLLLKKIGDVVGNMKLRRGNENKVDVLVARKCFDQRVHCSAE